MATRRLSFIVPILGLAVLTAIVPMPATAQGPIPQLTQTTIIEGDESGRVTVEVVTPGVLQMGRFSNDIPAFEIDGGESFAGVYITSADAPGEVGETSYLGMRAPTYFDSWNELSINTAETGTGNFCTQCPLEPGLYNIYLISDGPATLTLTVEGLAPATDETPVLETTPVQAQIEAPTPTDIDGPEETVRYWSAHALGRLSSTGAYITLYLIEGPTTETLTTVARGTCDYSFGESPLMGIVGPGCPGGGDHNLDGSSTTIQGPWGDARISITRPLPPSALDYGFGTYAGVVGTSSHFGLVAVWLPF